MATISRTFNGDADILGTAGAFTSLSGTTESFSSAVDMVTNGYEGSHVMVEVNFDATPTDHVEVHIYGRNDTSTFTGDELPMQSYTVPNDLNDPAETGFIIRDVAYFRVGCVQTGSTDSHDVYVHHNPWRWQSV